jgi:Zn-finger nucleic acid-binding protein
MNCTNCRGGLQQMGNRPYFRCPHCETFHFPNETADGIDVIGEESHFDCPICAEPLASAAADGQPVLFCEGCRGFLVNNATFGIIVQKRRSERKPVAASFEPFSPDELHRRIACPNCKRRMDTHPYHAGGNAVIDTCAPCRLVWLDAEELAVIARYPARRPMV